MIEKTDDALNGLNDKMRSISDRITPNIILMITIVNGFLLGILTTGFLGEKSIGVYSLPFALFIWQFIVIFVLSSRHIQLSTTYMNKFVACGFFGFIWQWQIFGSIAESFYPEITTINSLMGHPLVVMAMGYLTLLFLFGHCFKGNASYKGKHIYKLRKDDAAA